MSNLPESWQIVKLGDISNITYGKGLPTKNLKTRGFPVFGANGIIGFYDKYLYEKSQLLISCRGANSGTINTSPPHCFITNNSLIVDFPVEQETLRRIYYYFLQTANKERLVTGTAQPQVTINNAIEIELPLPPLNEQKRIVAKIEELFSELDKGIESLKIAREQLKVYRQAVLKHAFEGRLTAKWREENKDKLESAEQILIHIRREREERYQTHLALWKKGTIFLKPRPIKWLKSNIIQSQLTNVPSVWAWEKIGNFSSVLGGKRLPKGHDYSPIVTKYPYIRVVDFENFTIQQSKLKYITEETQNKISQYVIGKDDVYISIAGTIGRVGVVPNELDGANLTENAAKISYITGVEKKYLAYWLHSKGGVEQISEETISTTQPKLALFRIENIYVPICSEQEQKLIILQIEQKLSALDQIEEEIERNLQKAEALRQSILKKAFSGKLVTQDPNDEPASLLLERIRSDKELQKASHKKPLQKKGKKTYNLFSY